MGERREENKAIARLGNQVIVTESCMSECSLYSSETYLHEIWGFCMRCFLILQFWPKVDFFYHWPDSSSSSCPSGLFLLFLTSEDTWRYIAWRYISKYSFRHFFLNDRPIVVSMYLQVQVWNSWTGRQNVGITAVLRGPNCLLLAFSDECLSLMPQIFFFNFKQFVINNFDLLVMMSMPNDIWEAGKKKKGEQETY